MKRRAEAGFGLIESMLAILLLTIAVAGLAELYASHLTSLLGEQQELLTTFATISQMERLRCQVKEFDDDPCGGSGIVCGVSCSGTVTAAGFISPQCAGCTTQWWASCVNNEWNLAVLTRNGSGFSSYLEQ